MTAHERKNTELPCGYSLAQSWCALRSSWIGFNIAHSGGNHDKMKYYASFIRKLQKEMGIEVTKFDADILDGDEDDLKKSEGGVDTQEGTDDLPEAEGDPDYDTILGEARTKLKREHAPPSPVPRRQIFAKSRGKDENPKRSLIHKGSQSSDLVITKEGRHACVIRPRPIEELRRKSQSYELAISRQQEVQEVEEVEDVAEDVEEVEDATEEVENTTEDIEDAAEDEEYGNHQEVKRKSCLYEYEELREAKRKSCSYEMK